MVIGCDWIVATRESSPRHWGGLGSQSGGISSSPMDGLGVETLKMLPSPIPRAPDPRRMESYGIHPAYRSLRFQGDGFIPRCDPVELVRLPQPRPTAASLGGRRRAAESTHQLSVARVRRGADDWDDWDVSLSGRMACPFHSFHGACPHHSFTGNGELG